jgi:UDP-glucose 4-epimerase
MGTEPLVLDDLTAGTKENVPSNVVFLEVDVSDVSATRTLAARLIDIDAIIHCAAQVSVTASVTDPVPDLEINILGTVNTVRLAEALQCPIVFASSGGAVYGDATTRPTSEDSSPSPIAPYGISKYAAELYVQDSANRTGLAHSICRLSNVYGPRQSIVGEAGVVATFATKASCDQEVVLFGHGKPTRDLVHVNDVAEALVLSIGKAGTWNISTGIETSVTQVHALVASAFPTARRFAAPRLEALRPGEIMYSSLSPAKANAELGWQANTTVDVGIPLTAKALVH